MKKVFNITHHSIPINAKQQLRVLYLSINKNRERYFVEDKQLATCFSFNEATILCESISKEQNRHFEISEPLNQRIELKTDINYNYRCIPELVDMLHKCQIKGIPLSNDLLEEAERKHPEYFNHKLT